MSVKEFLLFLRVDYPKNGKTFQQMTNKTFSNTFHQFNPFYPANSVDAQVVGNEKF